MNTTSLNEKLRTFCKLYLSYAVLGALCVGYVLLTSLIRLDRTGKTVWETVCDGSLSYLVGLCINNLFRRQGMALGDAEEEVIRTKEAYGETVERFAPFEAEAEAWCEQNNRGALKNVRTGILASVSLPYGDYFGDDGTDLGVGYEPRLKKIRPWRPYGWQYIRHNRLERARERAVIRARTVTVTRLTPGELVCDEGTGKDPFDFGPSRQKYLRTENAKNMVTKLFSALVFGLYTARLLESFSGSRLVWSTLQVLLFIAFGVSAMTGAREYVTGIYRCRLERKTAFMREFLTQKESAATNCRRAE